MKIKPSIRAYSFIAILVTGITTVVILSSLTMHYFFSGMDIVIGDSMYSHALSIEPLPGKPVKVSYFTIASRWQDLPYDIRDNIPQSDLKANALTSYFQDGSIFAPPKAALFAMKVQHKGIVKYVSVALYDDNHQLPVDNEFPHFLMVFATAFVAILLFYVVLNLIFHKVTTPVEQLKQWAKNITIEQLSQPVPEFHYSELNTLANIVKSSMESVQQSVVREKKFLAYASHELRTPIAVTRSNTELLKKMCENQSEVDKQQEVIQRISRANVTMTDLTEAILWLNRSGDRQILAKEVMLGDLVEQIINELSYLLKGKEVSVDVTTDKHAMLLTEPLVRIVCTNLIRNAFQHTTDGLVQVKQEGSSVVIFNQSAMQETQESCLGFGLGLELTERIIKQNNWLYKNRVVDNGHDVFIDFHRMQEEEALEG